MAASMVVSGMSKVKQPVATAVCRTRRFLSRPERPGSGSSIDGEAALEPCRGAPLYVAHLRKALAQKKDRRRQAALTAVTDGVHGPVARQLVDPILEFAKRNKLRPGDVPLREFPRLPNIEDKGCLAKPQAVVQLIDVDARYPGEAAWCVAPVQAHLRILDRGGSPLAPFFARKLGDHVASNPSA